MIIRARVVVTMDGAPIENGAVVISGNQIVDVGEFGEIKARNAGEVIDLGGQALLPGLINSHCHLDYTCLRGKIPPPKSFADWIRAINAEKAKLSEEDYVASIREGFAEARKFGTTTIANLTAFPELIPRVKQPSLRTWWFAELIDVRSPERAAKIVDLAVESLNSAREWPGGLGLAPHAMFTASSNLYRRCEEVASREKLLLTTHLAESGAEMEMFRGASGSLYDFMKEIGRDMSDCGGSTPLAHFVKNIDPSEGWIIVHLNELRESDLELLSRDFQVVHCPRSHHYFGHSPFAFEKLRGLGLNICLGTDSLASNEDLSLFAEMRRFQKNEPGVSPEQILSMVTLNAARALGKPHVLGRLRAGYRADMIAIPFSGPRKKVFEEIVAFEGAIGFSTVNGEVLRVEESGN